MRTTLLTLLSVTGVSLVSLVGIFALSLDPRRVRRLAVVLVSFAVGALLGDSFIHLIPEALRSHPDSALTPSLLILGGMLLFFVVEKFLRQHRGPLHHAHHQAGHGRPELAAINVIADGIHNFIDGMLIAASYLVSPSVGAATTLAVLLHEVPQEFGDFGVLIHSGLSPKRAVLVNLATASAAIAGAVLTLLLGHAVGSAAAEVLLPIAAGGFIYIATADLIPELQHDRGLPALLIQVAMIAGGIAVMALLRLAG